MVGINILFDRTTFNISFASEPLSEGQDIGLLEQVISDQRQILSTVYPTTNVSTIPQMWCLCELQAEHRIRIHVTDCDADKEVEGFYDDGMRVEDDITLLWTDDK